MEIKSELEIFFSYAHEDEQWLQELKKHLTPLKRQGRITDWYDRDISAGTEWVIEIDKHLKTADIILLLISSDFIASDYCYSTEVGGALERHLEGTARVIPIILRPILWEKAPFGKLQALPKHGKAVISSSWPNREEAFYEIAQEIEKIVEELSTQSPRMSRREVPSLLIASSIQRGVEELKVKSTLEKPSTTFLPTETALEKTLSIQGAAYPINKIFSNEYIFNIPLFQRLYAWTTEQAEELLNDLIAFMQDGSEIINDGSKSLKEYFLGNIVLIKGDGPLAQVVDGQQRLTTLTILLAVLRALIPQRANELSSFIRQEDDPEAGAVDTYRLIMRARDKKFFQQYIQDERNIEQLRELDRTKLTESQKNIRENALFFLQYLKELSEDKLCRLVDAITNQCFLVVVSTPSFESAYRIFSILNDRGLNLTPGDILKAENIGKIPAGEQDKYSKKWEDIEELLGSEMFQALLADICMIYRKSRLQDNVLTEFRRYVRPKLKSSEQFIDEVLHPYADAHYTVTKATYEGYQGMEEVNSLLLWLNQFEHSDWIPPAIHYLVLNQANPAVLIDFFTGLERLTAGMAILREVPSRRIERFSQLIRAIDDEHKLYASNSPLQLTNDEQSKIIDILKGDLSPIQGRTLRYVLLRLNAELSGARAPSKDATITVEQVLPPSLTSNSGWTQWFGTGNRRNRYVNYLGNMVLLLRRKDPKLQSLNFAEKKQKYFSASRDSSPFELTRQVLKETEWTPAVIERRQRALIDKLKDIWLLERHKMS